MSERTPTTIRLTDRQAEALDEIGKRDDRSRSWLIRNAIDEYIQRNLETSKRWPLGKAGRDGGDEK